MPHKRAAYVLLNILINDLDTEVENILIRIENGSKAFKVGVEISLEDVRTQ